MDETLALNIDPEYGHTIDRKGVRMPPIEVITRGERRRVWTLEQKREIVAESLGPELTPTEVARKHGISSGLLYGWRRQVLGDQMTLATRSPPRFTQVDIAPPRHDAPESEVAASVMPIRPFGLIEILLNGGVTVRVDATVDGQALRRVLGALSSR
jgi:transposase